MAVVRFVLVTLLGVGTLAGAARAQAPGGGSGSGLRIDLGLRVGAVWGATALGTVRSFELDEPRWVDGEIDADGAIGGMITVHPAGLPLSLRGSVDRLAGASLHFRSRGCEPGPEAVCGTDRRAIGATLASVDALWYTRPPGARRRPFFTAGIGVLHRDAGAQASCPIASALCTAQLAFDAARTHPAVHGGLGIDFGARRLGFSAELDAYASRFAPEADEIEAAWDAVFLISLGARLGIL